MSEIKKGDLFFCKRNVVMYDNDEIAYQKGYIYRSQENGYITDEQGVIEHSWKNLGWKHYFTKLKKNAIKRVYL